MKENNKSKIYVFCPEYFKTGGTELLHQLHFHLKQNGFESFMVYPNAKVGGGGD